VRKSSFVAVFLMLTAAPVAQAQDAPTLSLDNAIRLALANNRSVANAALNIDKAQTDIATARSRRLPQFQVDVQASQLLQPIEMTFPRGAFGTFEGIGPIPQHRRDGHYAVAAVDHLDVPGIAADHAAVQAESERGAHRGE
jgi:hypothetical protein